jgi:prepilin-type N-terminal cleavage/methylation domain-containing protein
MLQHMRPTRAFTMLEMIVVIIIFGVLITLTVPRLGGQERRQLRLGVDQVTDFLTMFAYREQLGQRAIAIEYDGEVNTLYLLIRDNANGDPEAPAVWMYDRLVKPVKLPDSVSIAEARVDGLPIDESFFQILTKPNEERPLLEITLQSREYEMETLVLLPHSVAPTLYTGDAVHNATRTAVDLDATGRSREDW